MLIESTCQILDGTTTTCIYTGSISKILEFGIFFGVWVLVCLLIIWLIREFTT